MEKKYGKLAIFDISPIECQEFSNNVCRILQTSLRKCKVEKFKDGDTDINIEESVRGTDIFVLQSYVPPQGERLYELSLFLDAVNAGGSASRTNVVFPYTFGSRGERRTRARQPVPTIAVAKKLKSYCVDTVITVGIHTTAIGSIYNALDLSFENLEFEYVAANFIIPRIKENTVLGSADVGGLKRVKRLRNIIAEQTKIKLPVAVADKYRPKANEAEIDDIIGNVDCAEVYIVDDIGDTLGTLISASRAYKNKGAKEIYSILTHPVLGKGAEENLNKIFDECLVKEIFFGNTIPLKYFAIEREEIKLIPIEPFVAEAIHRVHIDESISALHCYNKIIEAYNKIRLDYSDKFVKIGGD